MPARPNQWPEETRAAIEAERGKRSASKVAADYGTTRCAVLAIWFRARDRDPSVKPFPNGRPLQVRKAALAMHASGRPPKQIAHEFSVCVSTVYGWIRRAA